jgi:polysaccharide deacetylase family protein (PEP-CTERM system associated)
MSERLNGKGQLVVSIDVEDWSQSTWNHDLDINDRAEKNTERILEILARHEKCATMFVLGKFAEKFPQVIKRIAEEGHEIASHGYGHVEIFLQTREKFRADVRRSKDLLEDLTGKSVVGYRAPDFSIVEKTTWALEILAELGFIYDSSIFPIKHGRYGIENFPPRPVRVLLPSGTSIIELPLTTRNFLGREIPVAGGGYHRLLPWLLIRKIIGDHLKQQKTFMAYYHPYEFDPCEFAEIKLGVPLRMRLHQGLGRKRFHIKFEKMLKTFDVIRALDLTNQFEVPNYALST